MYVTIRARGYLIENKKFNDVTEAKKYMLEQREIARQHKWSLEYETSRKPDNRKYVKPQKK